MVGRQLLKCNYEGGCETIPVFGLITDERATRCAAHKSEYMIDIYNSKCIYLNCTKQRTHNFINFENLSDINKRKQRPIYCSEHAEIGMVNLTINRCYYPNCLKTAGFNYPGESKGISCKEHIKDGMVACDYNSYCTTEGCSTRASFNFKGLKPSLKCATHKEIGMVNVEDNCCVVESCTNLAKHKINFRTKGPRTHCWSHVSVERLKLVDLGLMSIEEALNKGTHIQTGNECLHVSSDGYKCCKAALYNYPDKDSAEYCSTHRTQGMINKKEKRICKHVNPTTKQQCSKRGTFSIKSKDGKYGDLFCAEHKTDRMVSVYIKKKDFMITLNESFVNKLKILLATHESGSLDINLVDLDDESIINIINNSKAADKYRNYSQSVENSHEILEDEEATQRLDVQESKTVKVKSKSKPKKSSLDIISLLSGEPSTRLEDSNSDSEVKSSSQTSPIMTNIDSRNIEVGVVRSINKEFTVFREKSIDKPSEPLSKQQNFIKPSITIEDKPISCSLSSLNKVYKLPEIKYERTSPINGPRIDLKRKYCVTPGCEMPVHIKHDDYCVYCALEFNPSELNSIARKTKEETVVMEMKKRFPSLSWISDRKIIGGSSRRRPDLFLDLGFRVICVEVDENQHVRYTEELENKRVFEIHDDIQCRKLVFIRFNPDSYFNGLEKIDSCWKRTSGTEVVRYNVKKSHNKKWEARLNELESKIKHYLDESIVLEEDITLEKLFFDNCD